MARYAYLRCVHTRMNFVYMCAYKCIYIYIYIHLFTSINIYIYICVCVCVCVIVCVCMDGLIVLFSIQEHVSAFTGLL